MTTTPSAVSTASATASGTAMAIKDTDVVVLDGGKEQKQKLKHNLKPPPILVSPTPTPEQLGDLATAMVQKSEVAVAMNNGIDININGNINSSKNNKKSSLSLARSTSVVRSNYNSNSSNSKCKKEVFTFATVGHHDEMYEETKTKTKAKTNTNTNGTVTVTGASSSSCNTNTNSHSNSNSSSSKAKKSATTRIITTSATAAVSSASPPGLFQSSPSSSCNSHPPLISRYCGCCGDILSTKAYGFDEKNRDRRLRFHPQDYNNGIGVDRERIREAAESVRQRLLNKGNKISSNNKSSFSKSTKASRKKKKAAAAAAANHRNNNHNNNNNNNSIHSDNYHHHEGLSPWPEESLHMDMTILEGLISLKNTHSDEVGCRCWNGQTTLKGSVTNHSLFGGTTKNSLLSQSQSQSQSHPHPQSTTTYNKGSKKAAKASKNGGSGKTKTATKGKKTTLTKGAGSSVSKTNPETVVSTKTVIVRCPKTGKKIKKTVRVVKKLIKKKRLLSSAQKSMAIGAAALGATATSKGAASHSNSTAPAAGVASLSTSTSLPGTSASHKKAAAIPSFSVLGSGNKENNHRGLKQHSDDNGASPNRNGGSSGSSTSSNSNSNSNSSKKRSRDASSNEDDEDCGSGCSDDGSDDGTGLSSSLKKRRRNDEKADPDLRDRLMNCQLENGPLFPSQQELMELTTIRKRNALQTFYKRFNELRQFIGVFGDANVPQQFPENHSLGIWVNKMRMERKKWDTGSERTSLTERKIELLESIDFIWAQNHKGEIGWERRFQEIRKFKRKHGHCNVPTKSAENRALGRWVSTQRTMYKNYMKGFVGKSLTREEQERRIFLLLKEGFLFSMIPNGQNPGGFGSEDPDGEGSDSIETGAVPSSGLVSQAEAAADGTVTIVTSTMTTETAMEPATEASTPIIGGNECESERPKTSITDGKEDAKNICDIIEPKNYDEVSNNDNSEEKKDDFDNENDAKAAVPLSPSSQTKGTIEKPEAAAFSPPASQLTSIAQVSFTTTPTTTPSVSTTASPDRSPEKAISSSEEPNCAHAANAETITKEAESMEIQMKGCGIPTTKNTMPVAPSLKAESATTSEDAQITVLTYSGTKPSIKQVVSIKEATTGTESHTLTEIVATSDGNTTQDTPIPEACPQKENTGNRLEYKGAINRAPPFPGATSATSPGSDPMEELLSKDETVPVTAPDPSITTEAITNEKNSSAATEPRLVTSDGLRIIVTMQDFEDDASDRSPSTSIDGLPMMAPSPSRRSVRARKPSARQLEAEKKPLRETIIGR